MIIKHLVIRDCRASPTILNRVLILILRCNRTLIGGLCPVLFYFLLFHLYNFLVSFFGIERL